MQLQKFRVSNFRNIHDSGWVELARTTALVGRNESGKTNLLSALMALVHDEDTSPFDRARDFPADRMRKEYRGDLTVLRTCWQLTPEERSELAALLRDDESPGTVEVELRFEGPPLVHFGDASSGRRDECDVDARAEGDTPDATSAFPGLEVPRVHDPAAAAQWVLDRLPCILHADQAPDIDGRMDLRGFARRRREGEPAPGDLQFALLLDVAGIEDEQLDEILETDVEARRQLMAQAGATVTRAIREIWTDRPLKVRFHLDGDQLNTLVCDPTALADVEVNLNQRSCGFRWFFAFFVILKASQKAADDRGILLILDEPGRHLHPVGQLDLIRFLTALDAPSLITTQSPAFLPSGAGSTILSVLHDPQTGTNVSTGAIDLHAIPGVVTAAAPDVAEPVAEPIVLPAAAERPVRESEEPADSEPTPIDEGGELLGDAAGEPVAEAEGAKPASLEIANEPDDAPPAAGPENLEAPESATAVEAPAVQVLSLDDAGARMVSGLVGDGPALLVEHLSDFWYLRSISEHRKALGHTGLPNRIVPVPAGGAAYLGLLARLTRQGRHEAVVVLGSRPPAEMSAALGPLSEDVATAYVFIGSAHESEPARRFDLEDLVDPAVFERFVEVAYRKRIKGEKLRFDRSIPNHVDRCERALEDLGVSFSRDRLAKLIVNGGERRTLRTMLSGGADDRFELLFERIQQAFESAADIRVDVEVDQEKALY